MNNSASDEIFYSDDEFSDGESTFQVKFYSNCQLLLVICFKYKLNSAQDLNQQMRSALSYHPSVSYNYPSSSTVPYPSSSSYTSPDPFIDTRRKPHTHGSYASSMNIGSLQKTYLHEKETLVAPSNLSYSAAAKKAGDVPQVSSSENLDVTFWQCVLQLLFSAVTISCSCCVLQFMFIPGAKCSAQSAKPWCVGEQKEGRFKVGSCLRETLHHCHKGWLLLQPFTGKHVKLFSVRLLNCKKCLIFKNLSLPLIPGSQYRTRYNFS